MTFIEFVCCVVGAGWLSSKFIVLIDRLERRA